MKVSKFLFVLGFALLFPLSLPAGTVRSIEVDGSRMAHIRLRMGQSTVLRFPEKPKKIVLGNGNYYSAEFIENDLALQPQGTVGTNLFVYSEKYTYGFLLSTVTSGHYDDLVQVSWKKQEKPKAISAKVVLNTPSFQSVSKPHTTFAISNTLQVDIREIQRLKGKDFYILDLDIKNLSDEEIGLADIEIVATRRKKKLLPQEFVAKDEKLAPKESTLARVFLKLAQSRGFTLHVKINDREVSRIVSRRYL
ncbi:MAG: hypothetical protein H6624_15595 [Bdellovibrionaceae bacterium]|nr:hypothetical protein [Pseudobdellovibrionaceae bacterium]